MSNASSTSHASNPVRISLVGSGWLGAVIAQRLISHSLDTATPLEVRASTTTVEKLSALRGFGVQPVLLRLEAEGESGLKPDSLPESLQLFFASPTLIMTLPPHADSADFDVTLLRQTLAAWSNQTHFIYISSTSVYGPASGVIDEDSWPAATEGGGACLARTESFLMRQARDQGFALTIVRLAGLIGPGRHPGRFLTGRDNVPRPDDRVNLIHQTDAAECIARLALMGPSSRETAHVYNAVARSHPTRRDFYTQASRMLGLKPPEFAATDHFNPNSHPRVIDGEKLRRTLGYEFEHDDLLASLGEPLQ